MNDEETLVDNHSGTRLVLALFLVPLPLICGWIAWSVSREIGSKLVSFEAANRVAYVLGGAAAVATVIVLLQWRAWFGRPTRDDDLIDEMHGHDDDPYWDESES
jgi:hypothetical protein